ncbi:TonB family protein, partial [uncultured Desulfovibrio sp.]
EPAPRAAASGAGFKAQDKYDARFQKYIGKVVWKLRNAMYIPAKTRPGTYHATAQVRYDAAGKILDATLLKGSGDALLDKYVLQGIRRAGSVPPPPAGLGDTLDLTFTLTRQ